MKRTFKLLVWNNAGLFGLAIAFSLAAAVECTAQVQRYRINAGGQYTYYPSPFLGIPGGEPSAHELDFGVSGFFSVEYGTETATLLDVDLELSGNEMVQEDPPHPITPVTADHVADWLDDRMLVALAQEPLGPPGRVFADEQHPSFRLTDHLNRTVTLQGGFNLTFVDGDGMQFDLSAVAIPEPSTFVLAAVAFVAAALTAGRRRR